MRLVVAGCAALLLIAAPAWAQMAAPIPAPSDTAAKPARKAAKPAPKPGQAANQAGKAKSVAGGDGHKWEDLPMPKPKQKLGEAEWPSNGSNIKPTMSGGGAGMAIGF